MNDYSNMPKQDLIMYKYQDEFEDNYWFIFDEGGRWVGTINNPKHFDGSIDFRNYEISEAPIGFVKISHNRYTKPGCIVLPKDLKLFNFIFPTNKVEDRGFISPETVSLILEAVSNRWIYYDSGIGSESNIHSELRIAVVNNTLPSFPAYTKIYLGK